MTRWEYVIIQHFRELDASQEVVQHVHLLLSQRTDVDQSP